MTERERILEKAAKIRELARRGDGGEQIAAAALLDRLMKQYGISAEDLDDNQREMAWFRYSTDIEERLLNQVIYSVVGDRPFYSERNRKTKRKYKRAGVEVTAAERVEIGLAYEFYKAAFESELERFLHAFVQKNNIFPPAEIARKDPPGKELSFSEIAQLGALMAGMDDHPRRKMIEGAAGNGL